MARCATKDIVELMSDPCFYRLRTVVDRGLLLFEDLDGYELRKDTRRRRSGSS